MLNFSFYLFLDQPTEIQCKLCTKTFTSNKLYEIHINACEEHHKNKICNFCGKKFGRSDNRKTHEKTAHNPKNKFKCSYCSWRLRSLLALRAHMTRVHRKLTKSKGDMSSSTKNHQAESHEELGNQESEGHTKAMEQHNLSNTDDSDVNLIEEEYDMISVSSDDDMDQGDVETNSVKTTPEPSRICRCPFCKQLQPSPSTLAYHILNQHADEDE